MHIASIRVHMVETQTKLRDQRGPPSHQQQKYGAPETSVNPPQPLKVVFCSYSTSLWGITQRNLKATTLFLSVV